VKSARYVCFGYDKQRRDRQRHEDLMSAFLCQCLSVVVVFARLDKFVGDDDGAAAAAVAATQWAVVISRAPIGC